MARGYRAEIFNQPGERFEEAAKAIQFDPGREDFIDFVMPLRSLLRNHARGLNNYLAFYHEDVVKRFRENTPYLSDESEIPNQHTIFSLAAYMTYKMVDDVSTKTGVELPFLGSGIIRNFTGDTVIPSNRTPLISYHYRGARLKKKLPHVYGPVLQLAQEVMGEEPEALDADLSMPVRDHERIGVVRAMDELHFIGGAAETILAIEELAPVDRMPFMRRLLGR